MALASPQHRRGAFSRPSGRWALEGPFEIDCARNGPACHRSRRRGTTHGNERRDVADPFGEPAGTGFELGPLACLRFIGVLALHWLAPAARASAAFWSRDSQSRSHDWNDSQAESHSSGAPWDDSIMVNFFSRSSTFDLYSAANAPMVRGLRTAVLPGAFDSPSGRSDSVPRAAQIRFEIARPAIPAERPSPGGRPGRGDIAMQLGQRVRRERRCRGARREQPGTAAAGS